MKAALNAAFKQFCFLKEIFPESRECFFEQAD
jgi:hypothetical protein